MRSFISLLLGVAAWVENVIEVNRASAGKMCLVFIVYQII
ncbi:hypothetical protein FLA_2372 [Filimonas lacunae]|nr:hypothetical protein FLA_2372 [Filimonas lacunae]